MGWCHEFGPQIHEGCNHPMVAGPDACTCAECGVVCHGRFNGCPAVWERGPLAVAPTRAMPLGIAPPTVPAPAFVASPAVARMPPGARTPPVVRRAPVVAVPPVVSEPPAEVVVAQPAAVLYYDPPPPGPERVVSAPVAGLSGLRDRLDGLRLELKLLGETVDGRIGRLPAPSRERG